MKYLMKKNGPVHLNGRLESVAETNAEYDVSTYTTQANILNADDSHVGYDNYEEETAYRSSLFG